MLYQRNLALGAVRASFAQIMVLSVACSYLFSVLEMSCDIFSNACLLYSDSTPT
ncbi:hypothetical protein SLEP1_g42165 [Rubroshorea leprosula]|uniref:Uncharacterized protein n=1 Tax=Rubroshorea leprosula TaxID=152421 RepID=A0AAV5L8W3_9ROSI|nr:hypothetical protein SLEP1_g42165 [Rubroshorea leprosula]